jgi:glycosyltransferase involved in cell wall biosynthesis
MKILHIAPTPFFADRGCHVRILGEIRALQAQGHEIALVTYHNGRDVENIRIRRIINVPWYTKLEAGSSWHKFYLDLLLLVTAIRTYLEERPEIIHGHLHEGALIGKLVSLLLSRGKTPVIFDVQGSLTGELETYGFFRNFRPLKVIFHWLEKMICRLPDFFVCSSNSNSQFIKSKMNVPEHKVYSILDGIYNDFFIGKENRAFKKKLGIPNGKKIVIYTGSLMRSKGIDYLLDAIPRIAETYKDVYFLIVGYPVESSKKRVKDLKVEDLVYFAGKVDYFHLPQYLALADVAVDPKTDEAGEGSGKIVNYMGAGLPVICFGTMNNRMFLGKNGLYAALGNPEELGDRIAEALANENKARAIGEQNRERVYQKFSWHASGLKLLEVYSKAKNRM